MQRPTLFAAALAVALAAGGPVASQTPPASPDATAPLAPRPSIAEARARVAARWEALKAAGFSGAVRFDIGEDTLLRAGAGFADPTTRRPFTPETQFEIGSLTKPITAAGILRLQDQGRLKVSDPLSKFFPGIPADKGAITLHQLMTHSSGFAEMASADAGDLEPIGRDALLARAFAAPLKAAPGERLIYSNLGYSILAAVIEKVTGEPYETWMRREVMGRGGAAHTGYLTVLDRAGAARTREGVDILTCCWGTGGPYWNLVGNGGLVSTLDDFVAWRKAFAHGRVVSPAAVTAAGTGWVAENDGPGAEGYGWIIGRSPTRGPVHLAAGGNAWFETYMAYYPAFDMVVLVTTNTKNAEPGRLASQLVLAAFGEPEPAGPPPGAHDGGSPQEQALLADLSAALLSPDPAARRAFLDARIGPVFRQREGLDAIAARADALHARLAGSAPGKGAVLSQGAELVFVTPAGETVTLEIDFGGTPDAPRLAGFQARQ